MDSRPNRTRNKDEDRELKKQGEMLYLHMPYISSLERMGDDPEDFIMVN